MSTGLCQIILLLLIILMHFIHIYYVVDTWRRTLFFCLLILLVPRLMFYVTISTVELSHYIVYFSDMVDRFRIRRRRVFTLISCFFHHPSDYVIVFADNSGKTGFGFKELIFLVYGTHVFSVYICSVDDWEIPALFYFLQILCDNIPRLELGLRQAP